MPVPPFHPKAYLTTKRNVLAGLRARTRIIEYIEEQPSQAKKISKKTGLSYRSILYHLGILRKEAIVKPTKVGRSLVWRLTRVGQQRLT